VVGAALVDGMGANEIVEYVACEGNVRTAEDAYVKLHDRDLSEFGSRGYTGSWAEVPGIDVVRTDGRMIEPEAVRFARRALSDGSGPRKWEVGNAVPVFGVDTSSTRTVRVELDDETRRRVITYGRADVGMLAPLLGLRPAEQVVDVTVGETTARRKVETKATQGTQETRFFVSVNGSVDINWDRGHRTRAKARKALNDLLLGMQGTAEATGEVFAVSRRAGGAGLVSGSLTVTSSSTPVEVTVAAPTSQQIGWLCYAVASE